MFSAAVNCARAQPSDLWLRPWAESPGNKRRSKTTLPRSARRLRSEFFKVLACTADLTQPLPAKSSKPGRQHTPDARHYSVLLM
jgi:hypothetical protein